MTPGRRRDSCIGMNITEYASKAFLRAILGHRPNWHFDTDLMKVAAPPPGTSCDAAAQRTSRSPVRSLE
jgi:hypothetical protein